MAHPLTQSDLIFPTQSLNLSSTLHSLKRSALSITNRLSSITSDSSFVLSVSKAYNFPLVANERCGSWYIPPEEKAESVYFKSTDGHMNEWSFNLRRLNYQLLDLVGRFGGCVIVDSTRRGKSMPDALSKTIPIWCCVINRAIFPDSQSHVLYTPPHTVSASEHVQIEKRIDRFVRQFLDVCKPNIQSLRQKLQKPLRPLWVTQKSSLPESPPSFSEFHPIILCTASRRVHGGEVSEGGYIQGAADDHEAWARGLTPKLFWAHRNEISSTNEEDLPSLIAELTKEEQAPAAIPILIKPTTSLFISSDRNIDIGPYDAIISCTPEPLETTNPEYVKSKKYLHLPLATGKLGSRDLRWQLLRLPAFFETLPEEFNSILVCCQTGKDLSVGVALVILCLFTDDAGRISKRKREQKVDKTSIKQRLTWITTASAGMNPSRETLKSVNAFLMPDPSANARSPDTDENMPISSKLVLLNADGERLAPDNGQNTGLHIPVTDLPVDNIVLPTTSLLGASMLSPLREPTQRASLPTTLFSRLENNQEPWTFTRTLRSALPTHPSGTVTGTATFTPIAAGYLYSEEGEFVTDAGLRFTARRKYVYVLNNEAEEPHISVYFYDEGQGREGLGNLFVTMNELQKVEDSHGVWRAGNREQHLCGQDLYTASWKLNDKMVESGDDGRGDMWWEVRYDVKGPKKNYASETRYIQG